MMNADILKLCEKHDSIELLYKIARAIAESDSIGECYSYCATYTRKQFNAELGVLRGGTRRKLGPHYADVALEIYMDIVRTQDSRNGGML